MFDFQGIRVFGTSAAKSFTQMVLMAFFHGKGWKAGWYNDRKRVCNSVWKDYTKFGWLPGWLAACLSAYLTLPYLTLPAYQASRIFPNHSCILWQHDVRDLLMQIQSTSRSLCSLVLNQFNPVYTFISMYD